MRSIISAQPEFQYSLKTEHQVVQKFYAKYNQIDSILDNNFGILKLIHKELCITMNVFKGRDSKYSTETIFRMLLIKCIGQLSSRDLLIRVNDSMFLRNFARIGWGNLMSIGLLDAAWKSISSCTWDSINKKLLSYAIENEQVTKGGLRVDSTVCESNIHYPTDSSLLWDSYRVSYYSVDIIPDHDTKQKVIVIESHKESFGMYPQRFVADKNYYISMDDVTLWEEKIHTYAVAKKGMRTQEEKEREHTECFREMQKFRAGCEGTISVLKRAFRLARCAYRTFKTFASSVGRLVFCHNIVLLATQQRLTRYDG